MSPEYRHMDPEYVIETAGLTRRFGKFVAVNGLDLRVPAGSIYGFLGPNGAGKTTTIRLLLGLLRPSGGQISLLGLAQPQARLAALAHIGALVEAPALYPQLTGWENLEVIRTLRDGTRQQIERALATVRLEQDANRRVSQYSLGMCQRLGLAIALLGNPTLLVLDEPTNGLDPAGIHEMRELIRRLPAERGVSVFVSSHLLGEVEQIATHVGIIQAGRLVFQGTPDGLRSRYQDYIALGVDRPDAASEVLARAGWSVGAGSAGYLRVAANGQADAALLANQLVSAGLSVYHVSLEQPSLEDIFLQVTASANPEGAQHGRNN